MTAQFATEGEEISCVTAQANRAAAENLDGRYCRSAKLHPREQKASAAQEDPEYADRAEGLLCTPFARFIALCSAHSVVRGHTGNTSTTRAV